MRTTTKTMDYIFRPWYCCKFNHGLYKKFSKLFANYNGLYYSPNCFLKDTAISDPISEDSTILYLVCDKRHPDFKEAIDELISSSFYIDHYQGFDSSSPFCIIRLSYDYPERIEKFKDSKYSKLYSKKDAYAEMSLIGPSVQDEFRTKDGSFEKPYMVMVKDVEYFEDKILSLLDRPSEEEIDKYWNREFDSPFNYENEIFNSNRIITP